MSESKYIFQIQPYAINVDSFRINSIQCIYNSGAIVSVDLLVGGDSVQTKSLEMNSEDYELWTQDNPFLIDWVCQKLGFTLNN